MEHIREAVERAKGAGVPGKPSPEKPVREPEHNAIETAVDMLRSPANDVAAINNEVWLDPARLENNRIIAYDIADARTKSIDMLRTQVLQSMDANSWQIVGVTSPTVDCGKSVIAINLALSIARQRERSVLLIDMDLRKPHLGPCLGLKQGNGLLAVLEGRVGLSDAVSRARIRDQQMFVLRCETSRLNTAEIIASRAMREMLQELRRQFPSSTVIIDLPPMLPSDDVISILPQLDTVLFVAAVGSSTVPEIKECTKFLEGVPLVRFVLNKSNDKKAKYYSQYSGS